MKKIIVIIFLVISFGLGFLTHKLIDHPARILSGEYKDSVGEDLKITILYEGNSKEGGASGQIKLDYKSSLNQATKNSLNGHLLEDGTYEGRFISYTPTQNILSCVIEGFDECVISSINSNTILFYANVNGSRMVYQCKKQ